MVLCDFFSFKMHLFSLQNEQYKRDHSKLIHNKSNTIGNIKRRSIFTYFTFFPQIYFQIQAQIYFTRDRISIMTLGAKLISYIIYYRSMADKKPAKIRHVPIIAENRLKKVLSWSTESPTRYKIQNRLGKGGFAQCYRAVQLGSMKEYALKIIDKESEEMKKNGSKQRLNNEIGIMKRLKHQNILKIYQSFEDEYNYYLVLELCQKISLHEMLRKRNKLNEIEVRYFIRQLVKVALFLKQKGFIHRDIKIPNILLDDNLVVKLGDFGLAIPENSSDSHRYSMCGTPGYMAPEVVRKLKYSFEVDMWSIGVVAFTLLYSIHPFAGENKQDTYEKIKRMEFQIPKQQISTAGVDFIRRIFIENPQFRLTPQQALSHQFLTEAIPTYLPPQCYSNKLSTNALLRFCRNYAPLAIPNRSTNFNRTNYIKATNRTLTSYLSNQIPYKNIFRPVRKDKRQRALNQFQPFQEQKPREVSENKPKNQQLAQIKIQPQQGEPNPYQMQQQSSISDIILKKQINSPIVEEQVCRIDQYQVKHEQNLSCHEYKGENCSRLEQDNAQQPLYEWLYDKLSYQPYIYEFKDRSVRFGLCYHLSNNAKVIVFNDKSSIAICEQTKKILYIEPISPEAEEFQRRLYKLVNSVNAPFGYHLESDKKKLACPQTSPQKQAGKNPYKIVEFTTTELPKNTHILKKYFTLRDYCRSCSRNISLPNFLKLEEVSLLKCAMMLNKWASVKQAGQYMFLTKNYIQTSFPDGTNFFILKKQSKVLITNEDERVRKVLELEQMKRKKLNRKLRKQLDIVGNFLQYFTTEERRKKEKLELYGVNFSTQAV